MPSSDSWLIRIAQQAAEEAQARITGLLQEQADLKNRQAAVDAALSLARTAVARLDQFQSLLGKQDFYCPLCWINGGVQSTLRAIPRATSADLFRCNNCHSEFSTNDLDKIIAHLKINHLGEQKGYTLLGDPRHSAWQYKHPVPKHRPAKKGEGRRS